MNFSQKTLSAVRNRKSAHRQFQAVVNLQALCLPEVDLLEQLQEQRTTEWAFASERKQRLSERSLHHIVQQAGKVARLSFLGNVLDLLFTPKLITRTRSDL